MNLNCVFEELTNIGYINEMKIYRNYDMIDSPELCLEIIICELPHHNSDCEKRVVFQGVKELRIDNVEKMVKVFFTIKDISDWQLEGIKYKIVEEEYNLFSFMCNSISF